MHAPISQKNKNVTHEGFTLIEFVVIISIFAIMAAVALFNFQGFRSNVALNNVSHDIALTIRQAQVFGWASQTDTNANVPYVDANGNLQRYADGVYFPQNANGYLQEFWHYTKTDPTAGQEAYFLNDIINDIVKMQGTVKIADIKTGNSISDLQITPAREVPTANVQSMGADVSIAFSRPRPEAMFFKGGQQIASPYLAIYISGADASDPLHADHAIFVSQFGEIEVQ